MAVYIVECTSFLAFVLYRYMVFKPVFWCLQVKGLNYLDFYIVDISAMLLIVLEMHFNQLFSNKTYFRVCFEMSKIQLPFFSC